MVDDLYDHATWMRRHRPIYWQDILLLTDDASARPLKIESVLRCMHQSTCHDIGDSRSLTDSEDAKRRCCLNRLLGYAPISMTYRPLVGADAISKPTSPLLTMIAWAGGTILRGKRSRVACASVWQTLNPSKRFVSILLQTAERVSSLDIAQPLALLRIPSLPDPVRGACVRPARRYTRHVDLAVQLGV